MCPIGSICATIGMKMNMTDGRLSFIIDGVAEVLHADIPLDQSLCFCVLLYDAKDSLRIVELA
jgi:hypothetical protein